MPKTKYDVRQVPTLMADHAIDEMGVCGLDASLSLDTSGVGNYSEFIVSMVFEDCCLEGLELDKVMV